MDETERKQKLARLCVTKCLQLIFTAMLLGYTVNKYKVVAENFPGPNLSTTQYFLKDSFVHTTIFIFPVIIVPTSVTASFHRLKHVSDPVEVSKGTFLGHLLDIVSFAMYFTNGCVVAHHWATISTPFPVQMIAVGSFIISVLFLLQPVIVKYVKKNN